MNRLFIWLLLVVCPTIAFTQTVYTSGKDWMYAKNNTEFTYRFLLEKNGKLSGEAPILKPGASFPLKLKSRPKNVKNTKLILEYDETCYGIDMRIRYQQFRNQAIKKLLWEGLWKALDDYYLDGTFSTILDYAETMTKAEQKELEEIMEDVTKQYLESQLDPISDMKERRIRAAVVGALTLAKGFVEIGDIASSKAMKSLANQLGTRKVYPISQFMRKQNYYRVLVEAGMPVYNNYNYNGNEIQDYGNYKNTVRPYFSRVILKSRPFLKQGRLSANFFVGFEYSKSPFTFQDSLGSFSTSGIGHSFVHSGGSLGVDIRKEKGNSCLGFYMEAGGISTKSKRYEYDLVNGAYALNNAGPLIEEETRGYFSISPYVSFKGVSIFGRWYAVLVPQEEIATAKLDYDQLIVGISIPLIVQRRYH